MPKIPKSIEKSRKTATSFPGVTGHSLPATQCRTTKPFIDSLSLDLFYLILSLCPSPSLLSATLVCKHWHNIAQRVIDGSIDGLVLSPGSHDANMRLFKRLGDDGAFRARVYEIRVAEWYGSGLLPSITEHERFENNLFVDLRRTAAAASKRFFRGDWVDQEMRSECTWEQLSCLVTILQSMTLSTFTWDAKPAIPEALLKQVCAQQSCRLRVGLRTDNQETIDFLFPAMQNHQGLSSLQQATSSIAGLGVVLPISEPSLFIELGKLVAACTRLRELGIYAGGRKFARDSYEYDLDRSAPQHAENDPFVSKYDCHWLKQHLSYGERLPYLAHLELSNFCMCEEEHRQEWSDLFDWSRLTSLKLNCPSFPLQLGGSGLASLKRLDLHLDSESDNGGKGCRKSTWTRADIEEFLLSCDNLVELTLVNGTAAVTAAVLLHLGRHLCFLKLHEYQSFLVPFQRSVLSNELLECLGHHCPRITDLAIDAPNELVLEGRFIPEPGQPAPLANVIEDEQLWQTLDVIAEHLWFVPRLEINLETEQFGQRLEHNETRSTVTLGFVQEIWDRLLIRSCELLAKADVDEQSPSGRVPRFEKLLVSVGSFIPIDRNRFWCTHHSRMAPRFIERRFETHRGLSEQGSARAIKSVELEELEKYVREDPTLRYLSRSERDIATIKHYATIGVPKSIVVRV